MQRVAKPKARIQGSPEAPSGLGHLAGSGEACWACYWSAWSKCPRPFCVPKMEESSWFHWDHSKFGQTQGPTPNASTSSWVEPPLSNYYNGFVAGFGMLSANAVRHVRFQESIELLGEPIFPKRISKNQGFNWLNVDSWYNSWSPADQVPFHFAGSPWLV